MKCDNCGYNHKDENETCEQVTARVKVLMEGIELSKSGYAGILSTGQIVDRREHPEAIAMQENSMLGIPKPKDIGSKDSPNQTL